MSNASDPQEQAEQLDPDKLVGDHDDPTAGGEFPPDEPLGVDEYGTTANEEKFDEPLAERVAREEPDVSSEAMGADEGQMRLIGPGAEDDAMYEVDTEPDAIAEAVDAPDTELSAEEAAVHPTTEPAMGRPGDGYVDERDLDEG